MHSQWWGDIDAKIESLLHSHLETLAPPPALLKLAKNRKYPFPIPSLHPATGARTLGNTHSPHRKLVEKERKPEFEIKLSQRISILGDERLMMSTQYRAAPLNPALWSLTKVSSKGTRASRDLVWKAKSVSVAGHILPSSKQAPRRRQYLQRVRGAVKAQPFFHLSLVPCPANSLTPNVIHLHSQAALLKMFIYHDDMVRWRRKEL